MGRHGEKTRAILLDIGLTAATLEDIEAGNVTWDVVDHPEFEDAWDLLLFDGEGGQRSIVISLDRGHELMNAWEFERRTMHSAARPATFASGELEDWTGVRPDSGWRDLVRSYRRAAAALGQQKDHEVTAPYLFLCRHTLELQLKAVIMLGQQAAGLLQDLPAHHDLQKLWTAAHPYVVTRAHKDKDTILRIREIVEHYHVADRGSYSFRYPVTVKNRPIQHEQYLHAFGKTNHNERVEEAFGLLDRVIFSLHFSCMIHRLERTNEEE